MSSKRTAVGLKKAAAIGGERQFKQTTLNFGQRPRQAPKPSEPSPTTTPNPTTERSTAEEEESKRGPKRRSTTSSTNMFDLAKQSSKENRPPPSPSLPRASASTRPNQSQQPPANDNPNPSPLIRITDIQGDLFSAPPQTVLIHACNAIGSWGGGIALAFKKLYPEAFKIYAAHCKLYSSNPRCLVGTALLIPPPPPQSTTSAGKPSPEARKQHWIGCLFTSKAYGRGRDPPGDILHATAPALGELMRLISSERRRREKSGQGPPGEIRMCQINSGLFDVPWQETKRAVGRMKAEDVLGEQDEDGKDEAEEKRREDVLGGLGDLPVDIMAYWRADL